MSVRISRSGIREVATYSAFLEIVRYDSAEGNTFTVAFTRIRRLTGMNDTYLVAVLGSCHGPEAVCVAALQSLALDGTGLRPLAASDVDPHYAAGQAAGRMLVAAAPVLLIVWWLLSRRKKKQSA